MANAKHLELLAKGGEPWLRFRLFGERLDLRETDLSGQKLCEVDFNKGDLRGVKFARADLTGAHFTGADLTDANLEGACLRQAELIGANLTEANLTDADLTSADLTKAILKGANLAEAHLESAILQKAVISDAYCPAAAFVKANLSGANLSRAYLRSANFTEANLVDADLSSTTLVEARLDGADLTGSSIYGVSAWDVQVNAETRQTRLRISKHGDPVITVDDLEIAQFIYLLLHREKLRNVINAVTKRGVLILGRFGGGGLEVLQSIGAKLRDEDYLPIIFDFERPDDRNYTETVKTLVGLARFVIVDLSGPSVAQELYATVPHFKIPFVPILEKGKYPHSLFTDLLEYDWVLRPIVEFTSVGELLRDLGDRVVVPAEKRVAERQAKLRDLFR